MIEAIKKLFGKRRQKLFISYRRQDTEGIAGRIFDRLVHRYGNDNVFLDVDSVSIGDDFHRVIMDALSRSSVVLAIIGEQWLGVGPAGKKRIDDINDFVRTELEIALERNVHVIPILIGTARIPEEKSLPGALWQLSHLHAAHVDPGRDFDQHLSRLVQTIDALPTGPRKKVNPTQRPASDVRLIVCQPRWGPRYISGIDALATGDLRVSRVAFWIQMNLFNNGPTSVAVESISLHESDLPLRPLRGPLVRRISLRRGAVSASGPLDLPIQVPAGEGTRFWTLCECMIPKKIGQYLYGLYALKLSPEKISGMFAGVRNEVASKLAPKVGVLGIKLTSFDLDRAEFMLPIVIAEGGGVAVTEEWGTIPLGVALDVLNAADGKLASKDFIRPQAPKFQIEISFGDGRRLAHTIETDGDVFWFGDTQSHGIPFCNDH